MEPMFSDLGERLQKQRFKLEYLTPPFLQTLFHMPAYVEEAYGQNQQIITDAKPSLYTS